MRPNEQHKSGRIWWILLGLAVLALIVYLAIPKPVEVKAAEVEEGELALSLSATGVVEGDLTDVSSRINARITDMYAGEGQSVSAGQILARLESEDLRAEVDRLREILRAAAQEAKAIRESTKVESAQLDAAAKRAEAALQAAQAGLREIEAGARKEDIQGQRAVVNRAKAEADDARKRYERALQLFQRGAISAQDLDTARAANEASRAVLDAQEQQLKLLEAGPRAETVEAAKAEVQAAQAGLREAQAAQGVYAARKLEIAAADARELQAEAALQSAEAQLEFAEIRSPITGIVVRKHAEIGELATPFAPIYTISKSEKVWITAEVDEEDAAAVSPGQQVDITIDAYPGQVITGNVTRVSTIAEPREVGRVRAKIIRTHIIPNPTDIPLRPGAEVNITGQHPSGKHTLLVPNDAVVSLGDESIVYVIKNGISEERRVEIGQSNFTYTQVLSGLEKDELVAVSNVEDLTDSKKVRIIDTEK